MALAEELTALLAQLLAAGGLDSATLSRLLPPESDPALADGVRTLRELLGQQETVDLGHNPMNTLIDPGPPSAARHETVSPDEQRQDADALSDASDHSGLPVSSRYALCSVLGRGGMGEVWLADDKLLGRAVAVKVLRPESQGSEDCRRRFLDETRLTARLGHPGIIPVHDAGRLADGRWFYTMRRIAGRNLASVLCELRRGDPAASEAYPLLRLLYILSQICLTVAYAHDRGVIHRDLKPENILLGEYGEVYVGDWGLSKRLATSPHIALDESSRPTAAGVTLGTPHYMSPEQARGAEIGPATDVWSLGVILFELMTLRTPFDAQTAIGVLVKIVSQEVPHPATVAPERELPTPIVELCLEAMKRDSEHRTLTAREMAVRIETFLNGVEEQKRSLARARDLLDRARRSRERYVRLRRMLADEEHELADLRENLPVSVSREQRTSVWNREQELSERAMEAETHFTKILQLAGQSLEEKDTPQAHELLAELYWLRVEDARRATDPYGELHFRSLVEQHDTGAFKDRLARTGDLEIRIDPRDAHVQVERLSPFGPILVANRTEYAGGAMTVDVGSYLVNATAPGRMDIRVPVVVEGNRRAALELCLPAAFPGSEDFAFVPETVATIGADPGAPRALPEQRVRVGPFLMGRYPVTMEAYCAFLNGVADRDLAMARRHAPRSTDGSVCYLDLDEQHRRFSIPAHDRDGDLWHPRWPVIMVSWHDCMAYCRWRTEQEGTTYRLPTELEWEVAARGVDRRLYPWGNGFDPSLCCMGESEEGKRVPAPVGRYELDRSPYDVRDMAGLVIEWTTTPAGSGEDRYIQRGGAFTSPPALCRAAARREQQASWNTAQFGFRVVRELPAQGGSTSSSE